MRLTKILAALAVTAAAALAAAGAGSATPPLSFAPAVAFAAGTSPLAVAIGDLNGDGKPDLVTADDGSSDVSVLLGDGSGGFTPASGSPYPTGTNPFSVAIGDLNGDGKPDLVTADTSSSDVSVLLGDGSGGFTPASGSPYPAGTGPASVAIGDLNGDGKPDLVTADWGSNDVSVLLGDGSGGFTPASPYPTGSVPASVAIGDLNGDGTPDLATADAGSNGVSVLLNTSSTAGGGAASVTTTVGATLAVSLDKASLDFGTQLVGGTASRSLTATVTSNDAAGYQLSVARSAFTPKDLPFTVACSACGLGATAIPTSGLQTVVSTSGPSANAGDAWATTLALGPIPASAPSGSYASTLTYTVVGL